MMKTLSRLFTLKPYGNQLIDGTAELWLVLAPLNILSIALCDAVAWAYFAYTTAHGTAAYVAAGIAFLIVFTLVASVDAMFVMYDRSRRPADDAETGLRRHIHRDHIAVVARIVLVIVTFTVTAPFLTQLFFARDIEANIQRSNERTIAAKRQEIVATSDRRIGDGQARLAARQSDLEKEIAGSGASARYGRGPTAAAIESEIRGAEREIAALKAAQATDVRAFDQSVATPDTLASRYGVDVVREGPGTRARVVAELQQSPSFVSTQRTVKAFLLFMFLGLVCLKLFQPESVRIYYSARLQAAYARLKAGIFNHRIDPRELPDGAGMSPIRFAEWYESDEAVRELTERLRTQEDAVRVLHETLRLDIARIHDELTGVSKKNDELEHQLSGCQHELDVLKSRIAEEQQALDDFRYEFGEELSLTDQQLLISSRNKTVRQLAEHRAAAVTLEASVIRFSHRLEASRWYENQLRQSLTAAGDESAALTTALQRARQRRVADILRAT